MKKFVTGQNPFSMNVFKVLKYGNWAKLIYKD
jgi:hypothetical protein